LRIDNGELIETTPQHRFAVAGQGFLAVDQLLPGIQLMTHSTSILSILEKEINQTPTVVYNLSVENFRTYYVGKAGIWVHNLKDPKDKLGDIIPT
jgi:hypothetical protein